MKYVEVLYAVVQVDQFTVKEFPFLFLKSFSVYVLLAKERSSALTTGGSPCYFLSSRGQKIKEVAKIESTRLFLFTFLVSFLWGFSRKN